jgi:hypothetical protein
MSIWVGYDFKNLEAKMSCSILIHDQELVIFNIMCTSWGPMFTSNQQIVVESQQGNTYGPMDMEV